MIYLDWAATAIPCIEEIAYGLQEASLLFANPSALHALGKKAHKLLETTRNRCAAIFGVPAQNLYFTSGGSESNSIAILSLLTRPHTGSIAISAIEHASVREQTRMLGYCGWKVLVIPVDKHGIITPQAVLDTIQPDTYMVSVMGVNNEIGSIQPIQEIADALKQSTTGKQHIHFHVDAVQAFGKISLDRLALGYTDSASMSAHKIGGPRGIGLLYAKKHFESFIRGGTQERNIRPGTENIAGAIAFAGCMEKAYNGFSQNYKKAADLMQHLINALSELPACTLIPYSRTAANTQFSPWILQAAFKGIPSQVMMRCLEKKDIYVSAGAACSSKQKRKPIAEALHLNEAEIQSIIRISIGHTTTHTDIDQFTAAVAEILSEF